MYDEKVPNSISQMHNNIHSIYAGMNLLSKFCIAVSATQKLNCVAVGVICVAVFLVCFGEKNNVELRDAFPAQPVQGIKYFGGKNQIVLPLQR